MSATILAARHLEAHAGENRPRPAEQLKIGDLENGVGPWPWADHDGANPPAQLEPSRRRGQRQRHRQIQRRAQRSGNHPAPQIGREDLRLLGELEDREHRDQRRVLQQCHEVVGHRRQRETKRLRPAHQRQHLPLAEAERPRRLELTGGDRLERRSVDISLS